MRKALFVLLATLALAGAACSSNNSSTPGGSTGSTGSTGATGSTSGCTADSATALSGSLTVANFAFDPNCFSVSAGSKISIDNTAPNAHTFTLDDGSIDQQLDAGKTVSVTAPAAGTYPFHCSIHPSMTGTLIVT